MKNNARIISLVLCALMLVGTLAACNTSPSDTVDLGKGPGGVEITGPGENGEHVSSYAPTGNKYDGAEFIVLESCKAGDMVSAFEYAEENPTVLDTGISKKNLAVEADYDVKIKIIKDIGASNTGATRMTKSKSSETLDYHLSLISAYDVVPLAYQDALYDFNSLPEVNLKNEWWDQNATRDLEINGLMFFTTGDIDVWDDMQQFIMMFNRTLFAQKITSMTVDEFYATMQEGKWTYDMFYSLAKGLTDDTNGNGAPDALDTYGMITWDDTIYSVFSSCGAQIVSIDESGSLSLPIFGNELAMNVMREYTEWTKDNAYNYSRDGGGSKAITMFKENRALFFMGRLQSLSIYRDMESDFGIVPVPKYTEDQVYNVTCSPYHLSLVCTLNVNEDVQMRGEVIESLAYYSRQYLTPAYREKTLEGQSLRDDGSFETLKITADNRIYDIGFFIKPGDLTAGLIQAYRVWGTDYASLYAERKSQAEMAVKTVSDAYAALASSWAE